MKFLRRNRIALATKRRIAPHGFAGWRLRPPVGWVRFGGLRRLEPISRNWGDERGRPIDRYYIERFLEQNATDIRGRVLEIGDDTYTRMFGGDRVARSDVLNVVEGNPLATIVGDLADAPHIPDNQFDCILLIQTLQLIYDLRGAIGTCHRLLRPGGVVLATAPGISHICHDDSDTWGDYWCWSFTQLSARKLFSEHFQPARVHVAAHGNVLASIAFLEGLAVAELTTKELDHHDRDYELSITVRARKEAA